MFLTLARPKEKVRTIKRSLTQRKKEGGGAEGFHQAVQMEVLYIGRGQEGQLNC